MSRVVLCKANRELPEVPSHIVAFDWRDNDGLMTVEHIYVPGDNCNNRVLVNKQEARALWMHLRAKGYARITEKCQA